MSHQVTAMGSAATVAAKAAKPIIPAFVDRVRLLTRAARLDSAARLGWISARLG